MSKTEFYSCDRCSTQKSFRDQLSDISYLDLGLLTAGKDLCGNCYEELTTKIEKVVETFLESKEV